MCPPQKGESKREKRMRDRKIYRTKGNEGETCSLMQDWKNGARGVSTSTALYNSAGVDAIWIASILKEVRTDFERNVS